MKQLTTVLAVGTVFVVCGPGAVAAQTLSIQGAEATVGLAVGWRESSAGPNVMSALQYRTAVSVSEQWIVEGAYSKWAWGHAWTSCWPEEQCGQGDGIQLGAERRYRSGRWLQPYLNASAGILWWGLDDSLVPTVSTGAGLQATGAPFTARLELVHQYNAIYDAYDPFVFLRLSVGLRFTQ